MLEEISSSFSHQAVSVHLYLLEESEPEHPGTSSPPSLWLQTSSPTQSSSVRQSPTHFSHGVVGEHVLLYDNAGRGVGESVGASVDVIVGTSDDVVVGTSEEISVDRTEGISEEISVPAIVGDAVGTPSINKGDKLSASTTSSGSTQ